MNNEIEKTLKQIFNESKRFDGVIIMVGITINSLCNDVLLPLQKQYDGNISIINKSRAIIFGVNVLLLGSDKFYEEKLRGLNIYTAYCHEISFYPKSFLKMLAIRMRGVDAKIIEIGKPFENHTKAQYFYEITSGYRHEVLIKSRMV